MSWHTFPLGYKPSAYCRSCGRDFSGDWLFDDHRVGNHDYDWSPEHEDGRRCLDEDEMRAKGWRPYTEGEMLALRHQKRRAGYDVEMWFDPAETARARKSLSASRRSRESASEG